MRHILPLLLLACHEQLPNEDPLAPDAAPRGLRHVMVVDLDASPHQADPPDLDPNDADPPDQGPVPDAAPDQSDPDAAPAIHCLTHADCPADHLCCTRAHAHESNCLPAADCPAGQRDACLTDEQCAARRPSWTTCCHDRSARDYCAPSPDTCQPLIPCERPADCPADSPCCSWHGFYQRPFCTTEFFAVSAGDCRD